MEKSSVSNIKLGFFITAGIVFLVAAIYFIGKKKQMFSDTFTVKGVFQDVSGLQVGNNVRFSGINVGIVENIQLLTDSTVQVNMLINMEVQKFMKKNVTATIGSDGLMGNKIMLIIPGKAYPEMLANNDTIHTFQPIGMDDILVKVKETSDNAASITGDLAIVMRSIRQGKGTIGKLIMDKKMAHEVDDALGNIKEGTGGFKDNMKAASSSFLLKGYFKKKAKAKEKLEEEKLEEKEKEADEKEEKSKRKSRRSKE